VKSTLRIALLIAALAALLAVPAALAAKGGKPGGGGKPSGTTSTGSLSVVMVTDANGNGAPNWNDTITFAITSTSTSPYVDLSCYQGGALVYSAWAGFYESYPWPGQRNMPLYSPSWTGGAADCVAVLNGGTTLKFSVAA
jgi:hypothetical protein